MGKSADTAVALMRMALALLDRAGESEAAARLQHAIDTVRHRRKDGRGPDGMPETSFRATDRTDPDVDPRSR